MRKKENKCINLLHDAHVSGCREEGPTRHQVRHTCCPAQGRSWLDPPADVYTLPDMGQRLSWRTAGAGFHLAGCWPRWSTPSQAGTCQAALRTPEG